MPNFIWPTKVKRITSGFRPKHRQNHNGVDIAESGTHEIVSVADGTVRRSHRSSSYGEVVYIIHIIDGQEWETVSAHMREGSRRVSDGDKVKQGQVIGIMGNTGNSTGQHLHFELHKGRWNMSKSNAVDPLMYFNDDGILRRGDEGDSVRELQQNLLDAGELLPRAGADGGFGAETEDALKAFQARHKLKVDGIAGPKTLGMLEKVLSKSEESKMLKNAVVINSYVDWSCVEPIARRYNAPIYLRSVAEEAGKLAETVYVIGGGTDNIKGGNVIDLSGDNRYKTAQKVGKHLGSL